MSSLASYRQTAPMTNTAIGTEVHQPLNRLLHVASEIAFDLVILIDNLTNPYLFVGGQVVALPIQRYIGLLEDPMSHRTADTVNVGKRDFHALVPGQFDSGYSGHRILLWLTLALLMTRIRTENPHHALAAHYLAVLANLFD
jgi:hypothetical protein